MKRPNAIFVGFLRLGLRTSQIFKNDCSVLACALCVVVFSQSARAAAPVEKVEQLRQRHAQARAHFAKTRDYGKAYREMKESGHELISGLLNHWKNLPKGSAELPAFREEIKVVFNKMARPLTEAHNKEKSFMTRTVWPLLADDGLTLGQAAFIVELTKPQMGVRMNDSAARRGRPTEPLGWDVQAAYALALIRSGKDKQAAGEIAILHKKVSINHARNPKGSLDYGHEAGTGRYRDYTDYLQLCDVLYALQDAIANDHAAAKRHLEKARQN